MLVHFIKESRPRRSLQRKAIHMPNFNLELCVFKLCTSVFKLLFGFLHLSNQLLHILPLVLACIGVRCLDIAPRILSMRLVWIRRQGHKSFNHFVTTIFSSSDTMWRELQLQRARPSPASSLEALLLLLQATVQQIHCPSLQRTA